MTEKMAGVISIIVLLVITLAASLLLQHTWCIIQVICTATLLAGRSLYEHVDDVLQSLQTNNLEMAREKLAKIVGRDVVGLDVSEICKAAIETLSESFSDGFVAPLFWAALFGLPGIACYKAINTADSMIGHKTPRYINFGYAAAKLDDIANYIPARISALLIVAYQPMNMGLAGVWREAKKHASPNSGYPEAAMAGTLGISLGGARSYDGEAYAAPIIGEGLRTDITIDDLQKSLQIYVTSCKALWVILLVLAMIL